MKRDRDGLVVRSYDDKQSKGEGGTEVLASAQTVSEAT